jgi:hypothetical protein
VVITFPNCKTPNEEKQMDDQGSARAARKRRCQEMCANIKRWQAEKEKQETALIFEREKLDVARNELIAEENLLSQTINRIRDAGAEIAGCGIGIVYAKKSPRLRTINS